MRPDGFRPRAKARLASALAAASAVVHLATSSSESDAMRIGLWVMAGFSMWCAVALWRGRAGVRDWCMTLGCAATMLALHAPVLVAVYGQHRGGMSHAMMSVSPMVSTDSLGMVLAAAIALLEVALSAAVLAELVARRHATDEPIPVRARGRAR